MTSFRLIFNLDIVEKLNVKMREYQIELSSLKKQNCERIGVPYEEPMDLIMKESEDINLMATNVG